MTMSENWSIHELLLFIDYIENKLKELSEDDKERFEEIRDILKEVE